MWIEIFSTGRWTNNKGVTKAYTEADLDDMASSFDPESFKPPATVGHPENEKAPAWGWMEKVKRNGKKLVAQFSFHPKFEELFKQGIYKNRSVGLVGGVISHVAFLGGKMPAVKGLKEVSFSTNDINVLTKMEKSMLTPEQMKAKIEELEAKVSNYSGAEQVALMKELEELRGEKENFSTAAAKTVQLEKDLKAEKKKNTDRETATRKQEVESFCTGLVESGQLTPALSEKAQNVLHTLAGDSETANFSAGEDAVGVFKSILSDLPKSPRFSAVASDSTAAKKTGDAVKSEFGDVDVDEESYAIDQRAQVIMVEKKCDYADAVDHAMKEV